jgi:hypothetical protein
MARAAARPSAPVQAFATRALTATARMRPGRSPVSPVVEHGRTDEVAVKTAVVAQGDALTSSPTSSASPLFRPAAALRP